MRLVGAPRFGAVAMLVAAGLAACGSAEEAPSPEPSASSSPVKGLPPEDLRASPADVATGLRVIKTLAAQAGDELGSDKDAAKVAEAGIEPAWERIEGTIKANDRNVHLAFEDEFALLHGAVESDDVTKAKVSSESIGHAADSYLARFPADGSTPSPSPSPSPSALPTGR